MSADADRQVVLVDERIVEFADSALTIEQSLPGGLGIGRQSSRHGNAGDDHCGEPVPRCEPCHLYFDLSCRRSVAPECQGDIVTTATKRVVDGVLVFPLPRPARPTIQITTVT